KGQLLYNLHVAKHAMRKAERAIVVEGYFDVLRLSLAGLEEVVAPLGTGLTPDQAQLVKRHAPQVILLYDSDEAGLRATFRAGGERSHYAGALHLPGSGGGRGAEGRSRARSRGAWPLHRPPPSSPVLPRPARQRRESPPAPDARGRTLEESRDRRRRPRGSRVRAVPLR